MAHGPITPSSPYLYCVPPHTHALLRYRVQAVTPSNVAYFIDSGVAVDRITGVVVDRIKGNLDTGPLRIVGRDAIDVERAWEGVPPEHPVYYSSFEAFQRLRELALVSYGTRPVQEDVEAYELEVLRQTMMDAHPDRGGTEAAFTEARAAFEAARRRLRR